MKNLSYGIYLVLCVVLLGSCALEPKADQEYIDLATENAYLQGYKAALKGYDRDSAWVEISSKYQIK